MSIFRKTQRFFRRNWVWMLIAGVIVGGGGYWYWQSVQSEPVAVIYQNPTRETISSNIDSSGIIQAKEVARLRFLSGGKVVYVGAKEGDSVKKNQTIASIDKASLAKQLEQNLNNYEMQRYDFEQFNDDFLKDKPLNERLERNAKKNQLTLDNSVISVEIQDIAIRNSYLTAPFSGILTKSPTNVSGVQLTSADYFEIVNPNSIFFVARIDESEIGNVSISQQATITLDAFPDESIETNVQSIGYQSIETGSGTQFEVTFPIPPVWQERVLLGMNGDASILLAEEQNALVIPLIATKQRDGTTYVDVKTGENQVEEREITLGIESEDDVQVLSGLSESDLVAIPQ